jgi:hypothetical protein
MLDIFVMDLLMLLHLLLHPSAMSVQQVIIVCKELLTRYLVTKIHTILILVVKAKTTALPVPL